MSEVKRTNSPKLESEGDYYRIGWDHAAPRKVTVWTQGNGPPWDMPIEELEAFGRACVAMAEAIRGEGAGA